MIAVLLSAVSKTGAAETRDSVVYKADTASRDSLTVSLVTCWPGAEVYELCGHEAIRIRNAEMDSVWNYGVFDFNAPNFIYRFVKGETDYMLAAYPFERFMPEYVETGRRVEEQVLNLTQDEARNLLAMLQEEALPENRTYRYNYVLDNCATRPAERVDSAVGGGIVFPDEVKYGTFRREMRHYHRDYPWYQFGIDLALGSGIDKPITGVQEMFAPVEMQGKVAGAHLPDGRALVAETIVLNKGVENASLPATPWWLSPLALSLLILLIAAGLIWWMIRKRRILSTVYCVWYGIIGLAGLVIAFLVFISTHEATSPNILLIWLNPLQLIMAVAVWKRSWRYAVYAMSYYNIFAIGTLLIVWPFQYQSANVAFFPLMLTTWGLALAYAIVMPKQAPAMTTGRAKPAKKSAPAKKRYKKKK